MTRQDRIERLLAELSLVYTLTLRIAEGAAGTDRRDEPMTGTQRLALFEIVQAGSIRLRDLATHLRLTPASATRAVDALEALGLARRLPDPDDRRGVRVAATRRGRSWTLRRRTRVLRVLERLPASAVSRDTIETLEALTAALSEAAELDAPVEPLLPL